MSQVKRKTFKFERLCKLESCQKPFKTNRDWKLFCCKEHQIQYWQEVRADHGKVLKKITQLEREIREIKENRDGISPK